MGRTLRVTLDDELAEFVRANSGQGTSFVSAAEYVRHLIRERKERDEAAKIRTSILQGYMDVIAGRTVTYDGDLRSLLRTARRTGQIS